MTSAVALVPAETSGAPTCNGHEATITGSGDVDGTDGPDVIVGSNRADDIDGGAGDDIICGRGGDDVIDGGAGYDYIQSGPNESNEERDD